MSQMNQEWYYAKGDQQFGPVDTADLQARLESGEVLASDLCWTEGMSSWQPVATRSDVFTVSAVLQPATAQTVATTPLSYAAPSIGAPLDASGRPMFFVGFWWRVLAHLIDALVLMIPNQILSLISQEAAGSLGRNSDEAMMMTIAVGMAGQYILAWLYGALMESSTKQATLGKMAIGVVVTDLHGNRLSFGRATGRHFAKYLSSLILCIGYIMVGTNPQKQGLHDQIAKTYVLKKT